MFQCKSCPATYQRPKQLQRWDKPISRKCCSSKVNFSRVYAIFVNVIQMFVRFATIAFYDEIFTTFFSHFQAYTKRSYGHWMEMWRLWKTFFERGRTQKTWKPNSFRKKFRLCLLWEIFENYRISSNPSLRFKGK